MRIIFLFFLSNCFTVFSFADKADSLQNLYHKESDPLLKSKLAFGMAEHNENSNPYQALFFANEAIIIIEEQKLKDFEILMQWCKSCNFKGVLYKNTGSYMEAVGCYQQSLQALEEFNKLSKPITTAQKENLSLAKANTLYNIGVVHYLQRRFDKASELYDEAQQIYIELRDSILLAGCYNNKGVLYEQMDSLDLSLFYYNEARKIYDSKKKLKSVAVCSNNIGNIFKKKKNYTVARAQYENALLIRRQLADQRGISIVYNNLSALYLDMGNADSTKKYAYLALSIAKSIGNWETYRNSCATLADIHAIQGNLDSTTRYYKKLLQIGDTLFNERSQKSIIEMQMKYESEKKEKELIQLQKKIEARRYIQNILIVAIIAFILISVLMIMLFRQKSRILRNKNHSLLKEKQIQELTIEKTQLELESKNRELATLAIHISNKNEILSEILQKLEKSELENDNSISIKELIRFINQNFQFDRDWERFKLHFESVNKGFFERLLEKFPDITPYEQRLTAYLRINLTTKELCQLLNISVAGVNKSRQRLRKKLGIDSDTNLVSFIQNI